MGSRDGGEDPGRHAAIQPSVQLGRRDGGHAGNGGNKRVYLSTTFQVLTLHAQLNTMHNVAEDKKTLKRSNSLQGKLEHLAKTISPISSRSKKEKQGKAAGKLSRSVSFSTVVSEERAFNQNRPAAGEQEDVDDCSSDDAQDSRAIIDAILRAKAARTEGMLLAGVSLSQDFSPSIVSIDDARDGHTNMLSNGHTRMPAVCA